jgi:hypothetical protein
MGIAFLVSVICGWNGGSILIHIPLSTLSTGGPAGQPVRDALDARIGRGVLLLRIAGWSFWAFFGLLVLAFIDERMRARGKLRGFQVLLKTGGADSTEPSPGTERQ